MDWETKSVFFAWISLSHGFKILSIILLTSGEPASNSPTRWMVCSAGAPSNRPTHQSARERVPQLRGPVTIHHSPIPKQATNLVMVAHFEKNELPLASIRLKKQSSPKTRTTFEKLGTKFSYASSMMSMRGAPCIQHGSQGFVYSYAILS